jgi:hypothetical protein
MGSPASPRGFFSRSGAGVRGQVAGRRRTRRGVGAGSAGAMESGALSSSMAAGSGPFPTRTSTCPTFTSSMTSRSRKARFQGPTEGVLHTPSEDVPPTGRAISVPYIHVLRYRDGLHVSFNLVFDRLLMLEQLDLVPAPRRCSDARTEGGLMTTLGEPTLGTRNRVMCSMGESEFSSPSRVGKRSTDRNHLDSLAAGASIAATRSGSTRREE